VPQILATNYIFQKKEIYDFGAHVKDGDLII